MYKLHGEALADARQPEQSRCAPARMAMIRRQLNRGFVFLRFEPELEQAFRRANDAQANTNRLALLIIAVGVLCLSPVLDHAYFGVPVAAAGWSRLLLLGGLVPVLLGAVVWCLLRPRSSATEGVITAQYVIVSVGLLANRVILSRHGVDFPIEFVGIGMVAVVALARVRSGLILPVGTALAGPTLATEVWLVKSSPSDYYHLAAAGVLALFATYLQCASDYMLRRSWLERQLLQLVARRDGVTGLLNRHALDNALARAHAHAVREGCGYGLAMVDIDAFGAYNNHYGHPAGDEALREVGDVIEFHARRPLDVCGRYGGEEFVILWMDDRPHQVAAHADRLRGAVESRAIRHASSEVAPVLTISVGLCHVRAPHSADALAEALLGADRLLYEAKTAGRNCLKGGVLACSDDAAGDGARCAAAGSGMR